MVGGQFISSKTGHRCRSEFKVMVLLLQAWSQMLGGGLSCAVLSLLSEFSHLIDQHSAVQLRPPPYTWLQGYKIKHKYKV